VQKHPSGTEEQHYNTRLVFEENNKDIPLNYGRGIEMKHIELPPLTFEY
jgi:hypothetical protein